jgi:homocysteine S-methyltransferase
MSAKHDALDTLLSDPARGVILMDGGMGTTTEDRGIDTRNALWGSFAFLTPQGRRINDAIHREFVEAGAEILIANTHNAFLGACRELAADEQIAVPGPGSRGARGDLESRAGALHERIIRTALASARAAVPKHRPVAVACCIGSVDAPYATKASVRADDAEKILAIEIAARQAAGSELILFETLTTLDEIEGAARAVHTSGAGNVALGFSCGEDGHTLGGVPLRTAVERFRDAKPRAFFVQCTRFDRVDCALARLRSAVGPDDVVGVYANDGRDWDPVRMEWSGKRISPEEYGEHALRWRDAGARIIGGCCGTGPEHIAHLRRIL